MTEYKIKNVSITGTSIAPQTIAYNTLTDVNGEVLPALFTAIPFIGWVGIGQDRGLFYVSRTTVNMILAMSDYGDYTHTPGTYDFIITGAPA